jgi:hypothetical protein
MACDHGAAYQRPFPPILIGPRLGAGISLIARPYSFFAIDRDNCLGEYLTHTVYYAGDDDSDGAQKFSFPDFFGSSSRSGQCNIVTGARRSHRGNLDAFAR